MNMGITIDETTLIYNRGFFFGGKDSILFPVESYGQLKRLFDEINKSDNHRSHSSRSARPIEFVPTTSRLDVHSL